jgi:hypothetical protein
MLWKWESGACPTLTKKAGLYMKVELLDSLLDNWQPSGVAQALPNLDWATGVLTGSGFPWNVPELQRISSAEPGVAGNSSLSIEAVNTFAGTDGVDIASGSLIAGYWYKVVGYTSVTYNSIVYATGARFLAVSGVAAYATSGTGTVERYYTIYDILTEGLSYDKVQYIRISTKSTSGGAYTVKYVGVIDPSAIELEVFKASDPETWLVKISADDCLQLLKKVTAAQWMSAGDGLTAPTAQYGGLLRADWDYTAAYTYLTFIGTLTWAGSTFGPGRYALNAMFVKKANSESEYLFAHLNSAEPRFIKIVDMLEQINLFLGYESTVNDGGNWSDFHSWTFYYNTANSTGAGGESLTGVGIDSLWVPSGYYVAPQYYELYSLFDPWETGPHSFKRCGDPLEILDRICSSFGMTYRTRVNSGGERYLECVEIAKAGATVNIIDLSTVVSLRERPNSLACEGVEIVSTGSAVGSSDVASNVKRGGSGSSTLKYDTFFLSANHMRTNYDFRRKALEGGDYLGARTCDIRYADTDYFCSLFVLTGGSGKAAAAAYSICAIQPKDNGSGASGAYNTQPEYGEHRTGGITFPKVTTTEPHYSTYIEVPAMALAHYLWNGVGEATDPVGFSRPRGDEVDLEIVGINYDACVYPPIVINLTRNGITKKYVATEISESIGDDITRYVAHTRDT